MESLIINRENDFCWLNAMRLAMKDEMFKIIFLNQNAFAKSFVFDYETAKHGTIYMKVSRLTSVISRSKIIPRC